MQVRELYQKIINNIKCPYCGKLLFKGKLKKGSYIEIKCNRCKKVLEIKKQEAIIEGKGVLKYAEFDIEEKTTKKSEQKF